MRFSTVLLALAGSALATSRTSPGNIVSAIQVIEAGVIATNNSVNNLRQGDRNSVQQALAIQRETTKLGQAIDKGTQVAQRSAALSDDESLNVATAVLNLQPQVFSLLDNLKAHKPAFDTALAGHSVSPIVKHSLTDQKKKTAKFGDAVAAKLAQPYRDAAPIINQQFSDKFDDAIAYFSS